jgi:dihydroceramidase
VQPTPGFWGPPTSSVDWCEANYEHSRFVAEWFNTTSSLALVAAALLGFVLHRRVLERRFLAAYAALGVVGLGSIAFHATLRFELQMLDELPMLWLALIITFILGELRRPPGTRAGRRLATMLTAHGLLVTALCTLTRGTLQFACFHISFGSLELYCLARAWRLGRRSTAPAARRLLAVGFTAYAVAIAAWFVDLKACSFVARVLPAHGLANPQLHAVWHVLVSVGFYAILLLIGHERLVLLGRRPTIETRFGVIPTVRRGRAPGPILQTGEVLLPDESSS